MRCFVSGADGFVGSHLCEALRDAGHDVTGMARYDARGSHGWLDDVQDVKKVMGDIRDGGHLSRLMDDMTDIEPDIVFHLAAEISVDYSYEAPGTILTTNYCGTYNVLEAVKWIECKLVYASSSEVYGTAKYVPIDEDHPFQAQSPYAASKIAAESIVEAYRRSFGVQAVILRPFNTYGPRQSDRAVIPRIIKQALDPDCKSVEIGNREPRRDFTYVTDTVAAFMAVMDLPDGIYNAGSGKSISIGDLAGHITNKPVVSLPERYRPRESEVDHLEADASKLNAETGWVPKVSLREGLEKTMAWHDTARRT